MAEVTYMYCGSSSVNFNLKGRSVSDIGTELLQTTYATRGSGLLCFGEFRNVSMFSKLINLSRSLLRSRFCEGTYIVSGTGKIQ